MLIFALPLQGLWQLRHRALEILRPTYCTVFACHGVVERCRHDKKTRLCPALDYMDCKYSVHLEKRELMFIEKKFSLTNKLRKFEKKIYHKIVTSHFFHENTDLILALHKFVL